MENLKDSQTPSYQRGREAAALLLVASALFVALALASFLADPAVPEVQGANWVGPVGASVAHMLVRAVGIMAWAAPVEFTLMALPLLLERPNMGNVARLAGDLIIIFILAALVHVAFPTATAFGAMPIAGDVGDLFGEILVSLFSTIGSFLVGITAIFLVSITRSSFSFIRMARKAGWTTEQAARKGASGLRYLMDAWNRARNLERQRAQQPDAELPPEPPHEENDIIPHLEEDLANASEEAAKRYDVDPNAIVYVEDSDEPPPVHENFTSHHTVDEPIVVEDAPDVQDDPATDESVAEQDPLPTPPPPPSTAHKGRRTRTRTKRSPEQKAVPSPSVDPSAEESQERTNDEASALSPEPEQDDLFDLSESEQRTEVAPAEDEGDDSTEFSAPTDGHSGRGQGPTLPESDANSPSSASAEPVFVADDREPTPSLAPEQASASASPKRRRSRKPSDESSGRRGTDSADSGQARSGPGKEPPSGPPRIVDTSAAGKIEKGEAQQSQDPDGFRLPPIDLLEPPPQQDTQVSEEQRADLHETAEALVTALKHYGVKGQVREIQPGPTVTTFEFEPVAGTKVSKIAGLADDLAMNLGSTVRIIAPIPGKKRVGFEVPNKVRRAVSLRELVEDRRFQRLQMPLPVVLGRDIVGAPFYADLSTMPHLLVAGATGAGKSVGLNVMLVSLLYRRTPDELRLLMIDPKVVELQSYDGVPHMLLPVVTDTKKAAVALKWAVDEMERRYQLLADSGTKNIKTYNAWVQRVLDGKVPGYAPAEPTVMTTEQGAKVELGPVDQPRPLPEKLPYILIVIDEFADLMMQQGKDVEASVARLAQKARAAGMHIILATQRPSVDVITGMIKANFPTRIAFKVTQRIDSRTILDEQGAEHLLGRGDMLVKLNGKNETMRVQCPFVSEEEVDAVTSFLRKQGTPEYNEAILEGASDDKSADTSDAEDDPKYDEAVRIVAETRRCSTSWLQRKLGIGYNRAARIVEVMEARGIVGPAIGAKNREVLIDPL